MKGIEMDVQVLDIETVITQSSEKTLDEILASVASELSKRQKTEYKWEPWKTQLKTDGLDDLVTLRNYILKKEKWYAYRGLTEGVKDLLEDELFQKADQQELSQRCIQITANLGCDRNFSQKPFVPITLETHQLKPIDRQHAVDAFLRIICNRWWSFESKKLACANELIRSRNSLIASSCFPGGGKTFYLELLGSCVSQVNKMKLKKLLYWSDEKSFNCSEYLSGLIVLKVSFGGLSPYMRSVGDYAEAINAIILRLFYAFFCNSASSAESFRSFESLLFQDITKKFRYVLDCFKFFDQFLGRNANYLLLFDELEKSHSGPELCSEICKLMDSFASPKIACFFTNLDSSSLAGSILTKSGRCIDWISLPPPSLKSVIELFSPYNLPQLIVVDVSVHWRTIMLLLNQIERNREYNYDDLFEDIVGELRRHYILLIDNPLVEVCFSRKKYSLQSKIGDFTVSELLSKGVFINSIENYSLPICPEIPILYLKFWSSTFSTPNNHLQQQFIHLFKLDDSTSFTPLSFESFNAYWLSIYHYCQCEEAGVQMKISDFFLSCYLKDTSFYDRVLTFNKMMNVVKLENIDDIEQINYSTIYLMPDNNSGYDILIFYEDTNNKTVAFAFEIKFARKYFTIQDAIAKRNSTQKSLQRLQRVCHFKLVDFYLLFPLWRLLDENSFRDCKVPNIILFPKEKLQFLYGPLARRAYF